MSWFVFVSIMVGFTVSWIIVTKESLKRIRQQVLDDYGLEEDTTHQKVRSKRECFKRDRQAVERLPIKAVSKKIIWHYLQERDFSHTDNRYIPLTERPISSFMYQEERSAFIALLEFQNESTEMMNWVVKDWDYFYDLMKGFDALEDIWNGLNSLKKERTRHSECKLEEEFMKMAPLTELVKRVCRPKGATDSPRMLADATEETFPSMGSNRFEKLTEGVSGVSHLRAPYTEMVELLNDKENLMPEVIEQAEKTIEDIEQIILTKQHKDKMDKAWRDAAHIQQIRESVGLPAQVGTEYEATEQNEPNRDKNKKVISNGMTTAPKSDDDVHYDYG